MVVSPALDEAVTVRRGGVENDVDKWAGRTCCQHHRIPGPNRYWEYRFGELSGVRIANQNHCARINFASRWPYTARGGDGIVRQIVKALLPHVQMLYPLSPGVAYRRCGQLCDGKEDPAIAIASETHAIAIPGARTFPNACLWRMGSSTYRLDSQAGPRDATAMTGGTQLCPGGVRSLASTITGQCQRYQLYDRSPIHCIGAVDNNQLTGWRACEDPAAISRPVPPTGSSAVGPGNGWLGSINTRPKMIAAVPKSAVTVAVRGRHLCNRCSTRATSAPTPNSHPRVGEL